MKHLVNQRTILTRAAFVISIAFVLCQLAAYSVHAQTSQVKVADKPFVIEYYYKVKWGYADEFISLFKKNHYPLLQRQMRIGNILSMAAEAPIHHAGEESRWDYRIRIEWKNIQVAHDDSSDGPILKELFPDQAKLKREEQRRFEILLAHWDVPIMSVDLNEK